MCRRLVFCLSLPFSLLLMSCGAAQPVTEAEPPKEIAQPKTAGPTVDIMGPDGVLYPDFSRAGLRDGKREPSKTISVADHGAMPDDGEDDSLALQQAIDAAGQAGGAVVQLDAGQYDLSQPLFVFQDGVVIRGAGRDQTRLVFAYRLEKEEVRLVRPREGEVLTPGGVLEAHSHPRRLKKHTLFFNGKEIFSRGPDTSGGARFSLVYPVDALPNKPDTAGEIEIMAVVERLDGTRTETKRTVKWDPNAPANPGDNRFSHSVSVINFMGNVRARRQGVLKLATTAERGSTELQFRSAVPWKAGDLLLLDMKSTQSRLAELESARKDFHIRKQVWIAGVENDGKTVRLACPLRHEFEASSTRVSKEEPLLDCGLENLTLEQTAKEWIDGVRFASVADCWITGVRVLRAGRNPLTMDNAKNCLVQDCIFQEMWFKGGGGTGYIGWASAWDCLMENVECIDLRHAPNLQASAAGNVIRQSRFMGSDVNYHMLWAYENLIEQCEIDAKRGTGSYGYGIFAQKPEIAIHGPGGGPRNVIYNNKIVAPRNAVFLGGSNFDWIFAYNELRAGKGPVFVFRQKNAGHQVLNNVLKAEETGQAAFEFEGDRIRNLTIKGNRLSGTGALTEGPATDLVEANNQPLDSASPVEPKVPSLYEWQRQKRATKATASHP